MATVEQALNQVDALSTVPLTNDQPNMTPAEGGCLHASRADFEGTDAHLFVTGEELLLKESQLIGVMRTTVTEATNFKHQIYATRSVSKAIPQVKSSDQPNRMQLYEETVKALQPQVERMRQFLEFHKRAVGVVTRVCEHMHVSYTKNKCDLTVVPEDVLFNLSRLLAVLFTLDNLVTVKSAWNNDFSAWKRACSNLKKMDAADVMLNQELYMFLANNNSILSSLRQALAGVEGFKDALALMVNVCCDLYDQGFFVVPEEKFDLLKAITMGLALLDGSDARDPKADEKLSIHKNKRLRLPSAVKILKRWPIVPLIADMHIALPNFLTKAAPHIDQTQWAHEEADESSSPLAVKYQLTSQIDTIKQNFTEYMGDLVLLDEALKRGECRHDVLQFILRGMKLLSSWSSAVLEQSAWKFAHPTDKYLNRECPDDAKTYEKVVRYNYMQKDRTALIEVIGMIKDMHKFMSSRLGADAAPLVKTYVHHHVQKLLHAVVQPLIQHCNKKKRREASKVLAVLYNVAGDLDISVNTAARGAATKKKGKKSFKLPEGTITLPTRAVAPASTQVFYLRAVISSLLNEAGGGKHALMKEKDFEGDQLQALRELYHLSFYFDQLLNYDSTLKEASDLSALWYKEFYLELAKEIQFPIELSLPWILTSTAIENHSYHEFMLHTLELYNDSANYAVRNLDAQFLYDEIEAEVNLCFDQLVFEVTQNVYQQAKALATSNALDKRLKTRLAGMDSSLTGKYRFESPLHRFSSLLRQRHVQLLGRSVNLRRLVSQGIESMMRKAIDLAIASFDAEDITAVIALESMLETCRHAHKTLSEFLDIDSFQHMLAERNHSMDPSSHYGRIEHKIIFELLYDFMPHFCYNSLSQEFTRTKLPLADLIERDPPPKAAANLLYGSKGLMNTYQLALEATKGIFTVEHAASICRLIGSQKLGALINELCQNVGLQLHAVAKPYVDSLMKGMPKEIKMPDVFYGTAGTFSYYQALLKPILQYPDLSREVYQVFRVIGNTFALIGVIDHGLDMVDVTENVLVDPFAKFTAPVRQLVIPPGDKSLGFNIQGGREAGKPIVISKVEKGSLGHDAGLCVGDEILACGNTNFRNTDGAGTPIEHGAAVKCIQTNPGATLTVKNTGPVPYYVAHNKDIDEVSQQLKDPFFKQRCALAGPLHNAISITGSVFKGAMEVLNGILDSTRLRQEWIGNRPSGDVMDFGTSGFYRLWSALQFCFCLPTGNDLNPQNLFGEGLQWGGMALVYLLGQSTRFSMTDYVYRVLEVSEEDQKSETVGAFKMSEFVQSGLRIRAVNERFLNLIQMHYPQAVDRQHVHGVCHPPAAPGQLGTYVPAQNEYGKTVTQETTVV
eukprot:m.89408 g.89408  ORF g.89408 m.89408 type:complete len:1357 (+) comp18120_c0_seq1:24-4094(+)